MSIWHLYIDDVRNPPTYEENQYTLARTVDEAKELILKNGMPQTISFDHDLGGVSTTIDLIKWIIEGYLDGNIEIPAGFKYYVHSMNPVGRENIHSLMQSFLAQVIR